MKTIILYGMRGTGKSVIGKKLADSFGYDFIDLDKYISEKNNTKLTDFIEKNGWENFRDEEHNCLKEILKINKNKVISLGGGTIIFERNREELFKDKNTKIIYLNTDIEKIAERISKDEKSGEKRNSLTGKSVEEELKEVFEERKSIYENNCDFEVDNNGRIQDTIYQIETKLKFGGVCVPVTHPLTPKRTTSPLAPLLKGEGNIENFYNEIKNDRKIEFIELRLDLIFSSSPLGKGIIGDFSLLKKLIQNCPKKVICTNRAKFEGGEFEGTCEESLEILNKCLEFGADYIDIELESLERINSGQTHRSAPTEKLIISHHNFNKTPDLEYLKNILDKMKKYNPAVYKIAVMPENKNDVDSIFELNEYFKEKQNTTHHPSGASLDKRSISKNIFISMGELGKISRINLAKNGNLLTFGAYLKSSSALGQINYKELHKKVFTINEVLFLGGPQISGSFSPLMHNYSSSKLEKAENKILYKLEIKEKQEITHHPSGASFENGSKIAQDFVEKLESSKKYVGANITMPYKIDVYNYLNNKTPTPYQGLNRKKSLTRDLGFLDYNAKLVGALNTLYKKDGKIYGTNTDLEGIIGPILEKISLSQIDSAYILGAGGASRAAIAAMIKLEIKNIYVLNRSQKKLDEIENHFKKYLGENQKILTKIYDVTHPQPLPCKDGSNEKIIIINTLPFGFKENLPKNPIKFEDLDKIKDNLELYFEAVYDSEKGDTPIVEYIISRGTSGGYPDIRICRGIEMLIGQAKTGFELWTNGGEFRSEEVKDILMKK